MRKTRGFRLGRKVVKLWKWLLKQKRKACNSSSGGYLRLGRGSSPPPNHAEKTKTVTKKICNWGRSLSQKLRGSSPPPSGYARFGLDHPFEAKPVPVPKGHLAVYVGQKDDGPHRFLVPVIYFNHPLFGELLREAEREFGYHHQGGITIPCPISEFESVQMKIAAGGCRRKVTQNRRALLGAF